MLTGKIMTNECMMEFIESIGRSELYDELAMMQIQKRPPAVTKESFYLKGVCTTLKALGYDEQWVCMTFCPAFKAYYMHGRLISKNQFG